MELWLDKMSNVLLMMIVQQKWMSATGSKLVNQPNGDLMPIAPKALIARLERGAMPMVNADGQCRPQEGSCGSKKDCPTGSFCDYGTCEKRVPHINAFGFKYGTIFYNPICKLINKDSDTLLAPMQSKPAETSNLLHFYCEFIYEADAILHSLWRDEDWRDENYLKNNHEKSIECQLHVFDLQFRPFQIDMVDLQILNGHMLKISDCDVEYSLVTTPGPPLPTSPVPDQTTSASNG